jgi:alpha-1,3-mannosyltransferase
VFEVPVVGPRRFPVPAGRWRELVRLLRDADVVHLHDVRFLFELTALVRRPPVVLTTHGLVFHTKAFAAAKAAVWRAWYAPRLRSLSAVVAVSQRDAEVCRAGGVTGNVVTIPNGVDVEGFASIPDRVRRDVSRLVYFGRVAPEKGVERLAPLLAARPSWRLTVAGGGDAPWVNVVRERFVAAGVGDRVSFVGAASTGDLHRLLHEADCCVLPSHAESFGITMVEALAAGVPTVAEDAAAYREIGAGTTAGFATFDDGARAAAVIEATVGRWDSAQARARAAEYGWPATARAYRKLYDEVIGGGHVR